MAEHYRQPVAPLRHVDPRRRRGALYRAWAAITATRPMGWASRTIGWKVDPRLMRLTGGRIGFGGLLPTALLETTGARTGLSRANVVIYFHDGEDAIVAASHMGLPEHPSWFHNAVAHPAVRFGGESRIASVVNDDAERARLWELADAVFPPFARYRAQAAAAGRTIPLLRLSLT